MTTRTTVRRGVVALASAGALLALAVPTAAGPAFPDVIALPDGFAPEGIAVGSGHTAYAGSLADGTIVAVDLRSGEVTALTAPAGVPAVGLTTAPGGKVLYVAGGPEAEVRAYDTRSGDLLATVATPGAGFVNDLVVADGVVWATDSFGASLHGLPVDGEGVPTGAVETLPLTGDFTPTGGFNLNGIAATADGGTLVVVQSSTGTLFTVDPSTGVTNAIDLGGDDVANGDGIDLRGRDLLVVQNRQNLVTTVRLAPDLSSGEIVSSVSDPDFDVPTTIDRSGSRQYVVNARFGTPVTPDTAYTLVRVG